MCLSSRCLAIDLYVTIFSELLTESLNEEWDSHIPVKYYIYIYIHTYNIENARIIHVVSRRVTEISLREIMQEKDSQR
jgi:hypothetical protein